MSDAANRIRLAIGWADDAHERDALAALDELLAENERLKELNGDPFPVIAALGGNLRKVEARCARFEAALRRIASREAFGTPGVIDSSFSGRECQARMRVAREALADQKEGNA